MALILPILVAVVALCARAQGQPQFQPPEDGYQLISGILDSSLIIPTSIAQCDPFFIFYSLTTNYPSLGIISFQTVQGHIFLNLTMPAPGTGYMEWICNIPAGEQFLARGQLYTVQPGSSSACLGDLNTTYSLAMYSTSLFESYTVSPPTSTSFSNLYALVCFIVLQLLNSRQVGYRSLPYRLIHDIYRQV
jgi:hypothetical protein